MNLRIWILIAGAALALPVAGCGTGTTTDTGNNAAAPVNPSRMNVTIASAPTLVAGKPVVTFTVADSTGAAVPGITLGTDLTNANVGATIAQLVPANNAALGDPSYWYNYLIATEVATVGKPSNVNLPAPTASAAVPQATTEGTPAFPAGTLTGSGGSYTYTFATNITTVAPPVGTTPLIGPSGTTPSTKQIAYNASATHRVCIELRGLRASGAPLTGSGCKDFVPNGGAVATREIVTAATCNGQCHSELEGHAGTRTDPNYCAMCHNPTTFDGNTNATVATNSLDMKVMVHRIHMGRLLPSKWDFRANATCVPGGAPTPATVLPCALDYILYGANDFASYRSLGTMPIMTTSRTSCAARSDFTKCLTAVITIGAAVNTPKYYYDTLHLGNENFIGGTRNNNNLSVDATNSGSWTAYPAAATTFQPPAVGGSYFPDCTQCHNGTSAQPDTWKNTPSQQACGSCHDNIDWVGTAVNASLTAATGGRTLPHAPGVTVSPVPTGKEDNYTCAGCHNGIASGVTPNHVPPDVAHNYPLLVKAQSARFGFGFDNVTYDGATGALTVTFHVTKDGANIDYTDFVANPEWNPVSPTAVLFGNTTLATAAPGLGAQCAAAPAWTQNTNPGGCGDNLVPGRSGGLSLLVGWSATEHKNNLPGGFSNIPAVASAQQITLMGTTNVINSTHNGCPGASCTHTLTFPVNLPVSTVAAEGNTIVVGIYGRPGILFTGATAPTANDSKAAGIGHESAAIVRGVQPKSAVAYFDLAGGTGATVRSAMAAADARLRRVSVDTAKCEKCHSTLTLHGSRTSNTQLCVMCHNTKNTDVISRSSGTFAPVGAGSDSQREQAIDFKVLVHGLHAGGKSYASWPPSTISLEGFRSRGITVSGNDYSFINFPNKLNNCLACHVDTPASGMDTFALPLPSVVRPTTVTTIPPFDGLTVFPNGPQTQWESSRHTFNSGAMVTSTVGTLGKVQFNSANHGYQSSTNGGSIATPPFTGIPVQLMVSLGATGASLPAGLLPGTPYYVVEAVPGASGSYKLSTDPGGVPIAWGGAGSDSAYGGSAFTILPYKLADPTDDWTVSPTVAACSACHYNDQVKEHMVSVGGGVAEFSIPSTTAVTGINILPAPMTDQAYTDAINSRNGPGNEACAGCHGPGGEADVKKMHGLQ